MSSIQTYVAEAVAALVAFTAAKKASTAALSKVVTLFNANAPRADQSRALREFVTAFNVVTLHSDSVRINLAYADEAARAFGIQLENLTDDQVEEMKTNPPEYFCAGYLALCNSLLFYGRERGLAIADMVHMDLVNDINNAFDDLEAGVTPDVPRIAVVYESGHALDVVRKALADASRPDDTGAS